jgi:hypothetical protein
MNLQGLRRGSWSWLFAGLLLLGSSGTVLHDAKHWQPQRGGHACQLCLHHVSQKEISNGQAPALNLSRAAHPQRRVVAPRLAWRAPHRRPPIRGPPTRFD